jgi:hypothetical protein
MGFTLDNYTLLYIIIALFVVQLLVTRYYVQWSIEDSGHTNNKKIIKKLSGQINSTFDQYMGGAAATSSANGRDPRERVSRRKMKREEDEREGADGGDEPDESDERE